jgi:hypothetical protein
METTKFKVQRVVNLFEDTGSVRELNYLVKNYVFKTWVIALMGIYSSPSKICAF